MILAEDGLKRRFHAPETKLKGGPRSRRVRKRKLLEIPKSVSSLTCPLKTLLTPPSPLPQQNHNAKFCSPSMNSATRNLVTVPNLPSFPSLLYLLQNFSPTTARLSHYAVEKLWASSGTRSSSSAAALTRRWTWIIKLCQTWATRVSQHTDPQCSSLSESLLDQAKCQTLADPWVCGVQNFKVWEYFMVFQVFH